MTPNALNKQHNLHIKIGSSSQREQQFTITILSDDRV